MTKTILSFDIGTRHLAYCCLEKTDTQTNIKKWSVVDLMGVQGTPYDEECVWVLSKSWKCPQLKQYLENKGMSSLGKREELVKRIHTDLKKRKITKVTSSNLCVLASKIYAYLDNEPWMIDCDIIVLENQPCLTNPVMKSVQMLLYGYFLYTGVWQKHKQNRLLSQVGGGDGGDGGDGDDDVLTSTTQITNEDCQIQSKLCRVMLTSATNKLKVCEEELKHTPTTSITKTKGNTEQQNIAEVKQSVKQTSKYKQRKKDAITLTSNILKQWGQSIVKPNEQIQHNQWCFLLEKSSMKEKDDLSDSFLQGLYVLNKHT